MTNCIVCGAKLTVFNTGIINETSTGERICLNCLGNLDSQVTLNLKKYSSEEIRRMIENKNTNTDIAEIKGSDNFNKESQHPSPNQVVEFKRTCKECGKVWHVLASREKYLEQEKSWNDCNQCSSALGSAGGNDHSWGTWTQTKRNEHALNNELSNLKQCPNCHSGNYSESKLVYEK